MRIISKKRLQQFWESRKVDSALAEGDFSAWYKLAIDADWANFGALKQTFGTADQVGNCVVVDVGNNRFRLIGRVNYSKGIVYVLKAMDHTEYDKRALIAGCGCISPPPKQPCKMKTDLPMEKLPARGRKNGK